ncbi:DUF5985 family protein [Ramlibacter humi]|uniref:Uncharacterized protein n=1 Tax=Ramlibacter humi TaxID=2530451 RepID=A0A4Z0CBZ7_9BURK|nr:DUF5985 family protein [Ramlibacter humi]TFZ07968.1 hypothetical protein EZ216_02030 [Ramlibacter humi]
MAAVVYFLCALTCATCFVLLFRSWRASGLRLLFWSALCFAGMTINNVLLVLDKLFVERDLGLPRLLMGLSALLLLLYGLVWEEE